MDLLPQAWRSLQRNRVPVFCYILLTLLISLAYRLSDIYVGTLFPKDNPPAWLYAFVVSRDVVMATILSAIQAIVFAAMGKEIDRPLWKSPNWRDATTRFFLIWFILNLLSITVIRLQIRANALGSDEAIFALEFCLLLLYLFGLPIGACVMHWGRLNWAELPETLAPIARLFSLTLLVLLLDALQWLLHVTSPLVPIENKVLQALAVTAMDLPYPFLDCLAFAVMWRICMIYRDGAFERSNNDFDL